MPLSNSLPILNAEQRKIVLDRLQRASEVLASNTNHDYAINLLMECVRIDPANLMVRQTLRRTQKAKYGNNLRGSRMAMITTAGSRARLKNAKRLGEPLRVLEIGEEILNSNPWDLGVQMDMAEAADTLDLLDLAVFILDQARQKDSKDASLNRALARLFEKRGNFKHAIALWQVVKELDPTDMEANHKAKDLAAKETIQRGNYGSTDASALLGSQSSKSNPKLKSGMQPRPTVTTLSPEEQFRNRVQENPAQVESYLDLANYYAAKEDFDLAKETLEKGIQAIGHEFKLVDRLAEIEIAPLKIDLELANRRKQNTNLDEDDLADLNVIIENIEKEIQSRQIDRLRAMADRSPNDLHAKLSLGIALHDANRLDAAIVELQSARKDSNLAWKAYLYLGRCFRKRRNWKLAQRNLQDGLNAISKKESEGHKELLYELADGHADAGEWQQALEHGNELANLDFSYRDIGQKLDQWQAKTK